MDINLLINEVEKIKLHKQKKVGASLKKPLLLLLLISRIEERKIQYNHFYFQDIEQELDILIRSFGGRSSSSKPEQPFHHLNSSIIWDLHVPCGIEINNKQTINKSILRDPETYGYFEPNVYKLLISNKSARAKLVDFILDKFWPETVQADIRGILSLPYKEVATRNRNSKFAKMVLANYRNRCAVCGFSSNFNQVSFGVDAAHIYWHAYGGPDEIDNGIALCKMHHWAFDRGVLTVSPSNFHVMVSSSFVAHESKSINIIEEIDGRRISAWRNQPPSDKFLEWHNENIFIR